MESFVEQLSLKDWLIRFFFVLLCCFMVNRLFFFSPGVAEVTSSYILYPVIKMQKFFTDPVHNYFVRTLDIRQLQEQVDAMQEKNEDLQAQIIALFTTIDFENRSQETRDFAKKYDFSQQKLVQVLMRSFDDAGHVCFVDAGAQHGVNLNMIAVYKNNIVGRVIHVDPWYSQIALITDKRCKIAVSCAQTKTVGIYQGNNSLQPSLEFVPHYEKLMIGDMLMSTGQGLVYPQGFAIGTIEDFAIDDVAYQIKIQPLIDVQQLDYLYLVQN
jgi:rod shape-determining protein MreC